MHCKTPFVTICSAAIVAAASAALAQVPAITTVAGNVTAGYCGDGGPAIDACLRTPFAVAVDAAGALFVADYGNHRVRKVSPGGTITTVAGDGVVGFLGDGGPATSARLWVPSDVKVTPEGELFIVDHGNHRIRKVDAGGTITTVAGNGTAAWCGDGGLATSACLSGPIGIAVTASGTLFIADYYNSRVRKVDTAGTISTFAGNGTFGYCGDGGPATSACLSNPTMLALDAQGGLLVAENFGSRVRRVNSSGIITTVAGNGTIAFCGDGGPATSACVTPFGIVTDSAGTLFIGDNRNHRIRVVDATGTIETLAGSGPGYPATGSFCGDGGSPLDACFKYPGGVAVDAAGTLFIADVQNSRIRKITGLAKLALDVTAAPQAYSGAGQLITYTYLVTNVGSVALSGPFTISDDRASGESCPATPYLAPGASIACTGSYTIVPGDLAVGSVTNTATATNGPITSPSVSKTVTAIQLATLTLSKTLLSGCLKATGKVTLTAPAPGAGMVVTLASSSAHAVVPASVKLNAGLLVKSFAIATSPVASNEPATISASGGGATKTAGLTLKPMVLKALGLLPNPVVGGSRVTGTVTLECAAGPVPITVTLSSTKPTTAWPVTPTVTVPVGSGSALFTVTTKSVTVVTKPAIKGTANGVTKSRTLIVNPGS